MNYYFFLALLICTGRTAPECRGARKSIKAKVFISILHTLTHSFSICRVAHKASKLFPFYIWNIITHCIARCCVNEDMRELTPICQAPLYVR